MNEPPVNPYAAPQWPPQQQPQWQPPYVPPPPTPVQHPLLYPGAPATLVQAVEQGRPVKAAGWGFPDVLITLGLWFFFSLVSALMAVVLFGDEELKLPASILVALTMPWIGLAGWPLLVSWWKGNGPVIDFGLTRRWMDLVWGLVYGLAALGLAAVIALGTSAIFGDFDSAAGELAGDMDSVPALIAFAVLVGGGPDRGGVGVPRPAVRLLGQARNAHLVHDPGVRWHLRAVPLRADPHPAADEHGLVLAFARYQQRSLTVPIVAHMVNNIPAAIALVLMS